MKKIFPLVLIMFCPVLFIAQYKWDFGGGLGLSNYLGDIGGKENTRKDFIADMKMAKTRLNLNGFARMKIFAVHGLSLKTELNYLRIEGSDKLCTNPGRMYRNLDFRNDMLELNSTLQFVVLENLDLGRTYRYRNTMRFYVFGGIGAYYSNPKGMNENGDWAALRPLKTEGQSRMYSAIGICIPAGMGISYTFKKRHRISWELNWRTTFSDYLDDISTYYADPSSMTSEARAMANKTNTAAAENYQPGFANNYTAGSKRGDGRHNDSYLTTNITYSYVIRGRGWKINGPQYPWVSKKAWRRGAVRVRIKM